MKAEIYKDEGYKLMGALLQLSSVTISVGAERASGQPGGLPEISRGLSASDTPGTPPENELHPGGVPEQSARPHPFSLPLVIAHFWHPSRVQMIRASQSGGIASLCSAQPPANFCEPSGFVPPYYIQTLNHT
jgi:hypothetical protein